MARVWMDVTAQRFGRWVVVGNRELRRTSGGGHAAYWQCRCDCGLERMVCLTSLRGGVSTGCKGCCTKRRWAAERGPEGVPRITNTHWYRLLKGAASRGREVTVTKNEALVLFIQQHGKCALSGLPIALPTRARGSGTASLDRRDNKLGYVPGNIQWTHWRINRMKGLLDEADFIDACQAVAKFILGETKEPKVSEIAERLL